MVGRSVDDGSVAFYSGVLWLAVVLTGLIMALVQVGQARGTLLHSHHRNLIIVCFSALIGVPVAIGIYLQSRFMCGPPTTACEIVMGQISPFLLPVLFLWHLYRLGRGMRRLWLSQPYKP